MASAGLDVVKADLVRFQILPRHVYATQYQVGTDRGVRSMASFR